MMQTGTDPRLVKLRKYESILVISGFGVIAFGLWSIIRAAIYYFLNPLDVANYIKESDLDEIMAMGSEEGMKFVTENLDKIVTAAIFTYMGVALILRVYVGLSARRDGRRLRKSGLYIVVTWIMALFLLSSIVATIDDFVEPIIRAFAENSASALEETGPDADQAASVSILVDITSFLVLIELGVCSIMVRRLRKKLGIKPEKRRKKGQKWEVTEKLAEELREELNIPMNKEERTELVEEFDQQLNDRLNNIT